MDGSEKLLLTTIFLPLAGAVLTWLLASRGQAAVRQNALVTTITTCVLAGVLVFRYTPEQMAFAASELNWLEGVAGLHVRLGLGLDGLGVWLFGLTALLMITSVLVSWEAITDRPGLFYGLLLLLECGMLGVFAARDLILFYVFFEFTLIPLFFLIGIWGSEERRYAAVKFFIFTLAGSLLTFVGLLAIVLLAGAQSGKALTFSIAELTQTLSQHPLPVEYQLWIFAALFAGFAIKVPLFPLHTWLPLAHTQAPTAGSILLAGILLKIGTYGFLRFNVPMLPEATARCAPILLWLSVAGIIYGALVALAQADIKRLIAYSSVSHLGYCMLGMFALNATAVQGSVLQMINHGLSTGGLFALVGMIYERYHTREIRLLGGLTKRTPYLAAMFVLFTLSSIGLPALNGFAGEALILVGMFQRAVGPLMEKLDVPFKVISVLSVFGVVLGAWYMLWLVERVFFGPLREGTPPPRGGFVPATAGAHGHAAEPGEHGGHQAGGHDDHGHAVPDLHLREVLALVPLIVFMFWIGLKPQYFLERIAPSVENATAAAMFRFEDGFASGAVAAQAPAAPARSVADAAKPTPAVNAATLLAERGTGPRDGAIAAPRAAREESTRDD